jgi:uncharacterized protein DUF6152
MSSTFRSVLCGGIACVLASWPIMAHHSFSAEFDINKPVKLTGPVTAVEWMNPHVWFYIDVKDESGKVTNWAWELGSPNMLMRTGWNRNSLKIGEVVIVDGFRARNGLEMANAITVVSARTGQRLFAGSN